MVWMVVSVLGLVAETGVIIVLGRHVTAPYEARIRLAEQAAARTALPAGDGATP